MADVFISYARSTAIQAERIGAALGALGYSVWRDDALPVHRAYADEIEAQLNAARPMTFRRATSAGSSGSSDTFAPASQRTSARTAWTGWIRCARTWWG